MISTWSVDFLDFFAIGKIRVLLAESCCFAVLAYQKRTQIMKKDRLAALQMAALLVSRNCQDWFDDKRKLQYPTNVDY